MLEWLHSNEMAVIITTGVLFGWYLQRVYTYWRKSRTVEYLVFTDDIKKIHEEIAAHMRECPECRRGYHLDCQWYHALLVERNGIRANTLTQEIPHE